MGLLDGVVPAPPARPFVVFVLDVAGWDDLTAGIFDVLQIVVSLAPNLPTCSRCCSSLETIDFECGKAPRKQLATKAARKSAPDVSYVFSPTRLAGSK